MRGEVVRPVPSLGIRRRDGLQMIYPGKEHSIIGETESGKSWYGIGCVVAELMAGHRVVYIHFEEADPVDTIDRLLALGLDAELLVKLLTFVGPDQPVTARRLAALLDPVPSLVVLDGVNEALSLHEWEGNATDGIAAFRRRLVKPCTKIGAATLSCDHLVKDTQGRGRGPIGSVHKINGLTGVLILLENAEAFGRGQRGRSHVFVTKDRPGNLRQHGRASRGGTAKTFMGELVVDDTRTVTSGLLLRFHAPAGDGADDDVLPAETSPVAEAVHAVLASLPGGEVSSERALLAEVRKAGHKIRDVEVRAGVDDLVAAGRSELIKGRHGANGYRALSASRGDQGPSASLTASASASPIERGTRDADAGTAADADGTQWDADQQWGCAVCGCPDDDPIRPFLFDRCQRHAYRGGGVPGDDGAEDR
ncbi:hypothetical protein ACQPX6_17580 [Actinomycetospora sp. CA-101289]|uniref:hypothetical protein n=1 Tax=Actinomycetospora sp. CA-101289 TaxID=3239893 RepID=UPI003D970302